MNKHFYTSANTSAANIVSMDSLENALNSEYQSQVNTETFQRSKDFGRTVAERIFTWSTTDGSLTVYPSYVQAALPLWTPTPPNPPELQILIGARIDYLYKVVQQELHRHRHQFIPLIRALHIMQWLKKCMMFPKRLRQRK
jgi:hypothetical protein